MQDSLLAFAARGLSQGSWTSWLVWLLVTTQLTIFTVTLYLHRSQTHRAVEFHPLVAHAFRFWSWLGTGMVTREWVAIHRQHHAHVETPDDPHSPQVQGIRTVFWRGAELYRAASAQRQRIEQYGRGTPDDWLERHLYTPHASWGPALMLVIDALLFGVVGVAIWAVQMVWIPLWAAGVVNGLGHWWGYRNFETADTSTNLSPWGLWIGGEELHNTHHAYPWSARFALRKWEIDAGWLVIGGLRRLRLATVLRVAPVLDIRANVNLPDADTAKALLAQRFRVMSEYCREVIVPTLREDAAHAGANLKALPRRLRRALGNGGRWLDAASRERMVAFTERLPRLHTVCEFRARLAALIERNGRNADALLDALKDWCGEAEASGIRSLQEFAAQLKGYRLAGSAA